MPLKLVDPFADSVEGLDVNVNPYVAMLREGAATGGLPVLYGPSLNGIAGDWRQKLATYYMHETPLRHLVVEIGCHKGQTLLAMAAAHPDIAFVGLDITFKRVITTAQRAQAKKLRNVFTVLANANALGRMFAPGEIDASIIFFPDPWAKKESQAKNRLLSPGFCQQLADSLRPGGTCWLKTDQQPYFAAAIEAMHSAALENLSPAPGTEPGDSVSRLLATSFGSVFETKFVGMGLPTYSGKWRKPQVSP